MVRKTKEDALVTRQRIIDAARVSFVEKGVSQTSLEQVAKAAGVTRGAVYWHFKNKTDLFHAMREQVLLPLFDRADGSLTEKSSDTSADPLTSIENFMLDTICSLADDQEIRQTYEIMISKCEYVGEFSEVLLQIIDNCQYFCAKYEAKYKEAIELGIVSAECTPELLAADTHLFLTGLLHLWIKDNHQQHYRQHAEKMIKNHIKIKRLSA